jgi:hypothetical protein
MQLPLPTPRICSHRMQPKSQKLLHDQYCNLKTACLILLSFGHFFRNLKLPTARLARRSALSIVLRPVLRSASALRVTGSCLRALWKASAPEEHWSFCPTRGTDFIPLQHGIGSLEHLSRSTTKAVESAALMENPSRFTTGLGQVFDLPTLTTTLLRNFFYQIFLSRDNGQKGFTAQDEFGTINGVCSG